MRRAALLLLGFSSSLNAQSASLIQSEIEQAIEESSWRAGPFRLTPLFRLGGGYDDNGFSSATDPQADVSLVAAPGLRAAVPLGRRALVEIGEELGLVYFRRLDGLRDLSSRTRAAVAVGGESAVFRVEEELHDELARPTSEFDVPVEQRVRNREASLRLALGGRHELSGSYRRERVQIDDREAAVLGRPVAPRLDRTRQDYRLGLVRRLTPRTSLAFEAFQDRLDFDRESEASRGRGFLAGLSFSPHGNVRGRWMAGFKRVETPGARGGDFRGWVSALESEMRLGERWSLGALLTRDVHPSVLSSNRFFLEDRYGGSVRIYLTDRLSLRPQLLFGRNSYTEPVILNDQPGRPELRPVDRFASYAVTVGYRLSGAWVLSATGSRLRRQSELPVFQKERFFLNLGVSREAAR